MRCRECAKAFNNLFGLFQGLLTAGVSKRSEGRGNVVISCQTPGREEVEKPSDPVGVASGFALGGLPRDGGGSPGICNSSSRMGCTAGGGTVAGLVWSRFDASRNPDVDVASPSSTSLRGFQAGFDDRVPRTRRWFCAGDLAGPRACGDPVRQFIREGGPPSSANADHRAEQPGRGRATDRGVHGDGAGGGAGGVGLGGAVGFGGRLGGAFGTLLDASWKSIAG